MGILKDITQIYSAEVITFPAQLYIIPAALQNQKEYPKEEHYMEQWSKEIIKKTRSCIGDGAMVKNLEGDFGIYTKWRDSNITIYGVDGSAAFPNPSDEVLATFKTLDEMIEAGWVID